MLAWLILWRSGVASDYYGGTIWHSHEMLFGFTVAIIAGFLLTAVRNWTGIDTPTGKPLAMLALIWLLARLAPFVPALPAAGIALLDLAFLPILLLAIYRPLVSAENRVNRIFLPLLAAMTLANLLVHLALLGLTQTERMGIHLMINLTLLLITIVSARIIPFFTEKAVTGATPHFSKLREQSVFGALLLWIVLDLLTAPGWLLTAAALAVAGTQAWRFFDWHHPGIWRLPILWVLYSGLLWLIVGFLLRGLSAVGLFPDNLAIHALTAGAIGILTFGMMARISLGHTGRDINPPRLIGYCFILLNLAVFTRVFGPVIHPDAYLQWVMLSGTGWAVCFLLFIAHYLKLLNTPRIDGRPG
jgi:uncharacterized protein involved in response to NO